MTAPEISATNPLPSAAKPQDEHRRNSPPPSTYAFRLFMPRAGEEPLVTAQREAPDYTERPPDEQKESLKRRLADALLARLAGLQLYQFPYHQIACFERISVDEARSKHRHLELNSPEGGHGIQIILRDDDALVTIPFWHETAKAEAAFQEVWNCLETICKQAGYLIYDPQLGRTVELANDSNAALACYAETVNRVRAEYSNGTSREQSAPNETRIQELPKPDGCGVVLVAVVGTGAPCGFAEICVGPAPVNGSPARSIAAVTGWYVEPALRGRGIGRQLLDCAQAWAARRGLGDLARYRDTGTDSPDGNGRLLEASHDSDSSS